MQFSSPPEGNLTMNLLPAFSSESLSGLKRQTTLILSSAAISLSPDMLNFGYCHTTFIKTKTVILQVLGTSVL